MNFCADSQIDAQICRIPMGVLNPSSDAHDQFLQLTRHVVGAAAACNIPTTVNIARAAGIDESVCTEVLQIANDLGFVKYDPNGTGE